MRNIISKFFFTLVVLTMGIGSAWGACDPGTIFKFEVKDGLTNGNIAAGNPVDLSSYVSLTAGTVSAYGQKAGSLTIVDTKAISIAKKAEAYFIFTLSEGCSLQEGDIIKYIVYNKNALLQPETTTSDAAEKLTLTKTSGATTYGTVVIPAEHALIGESTFYLFTGDNSCKIKSVEISRPATITLDATTNGGTVGTTSIKGAIGDKVGLPHAFKTGKKFKGWYTTADGDVKKDDAYTIAGDVTLYAQFEDLPVSGEMFSLTMEDDLKPAAQCTIVSVVSKANQLLSPVELTRYATISGGSAVLSNSSTSNHAYISNSTASAILNGGNGCLTITLESALQVGDVITTSIASQNIAYTVEATRSTATNFVKGDDQTLTVTSESPLKGKSVIYLWSGSSNGGALKSITITRPTPHTLSYAVDPAGKGTVTLGTTSLIEGATTTATYSAIDAAYEFDEWQISGTGATLSSTSTNPTTITMGSVDATVTLKLKAAVTKYTITYNPGAYGTGDAIPDGKKDEGVDFTLSSSTYSRDGYVQTGWSETDGGDKAYDLGGTYSTDDDEELFPFWTPVYTVTKGTHEHGDFTISPASSVAGGTVTLDPTPADGYMFSAWEIVKTSDASATGITVTNKQFEMPAYGVTVNATFVADTRKKVLYLTTASTENDKLYAALKDDYNLAVAAPGSQTLTDYDLIVLHESIGGSVAGSDGPVKDAATTSVPVLNTKTYFYNSGRWNWGTPNNGQAAQKVATLNSGYCNIADHPIFSGVTISAGEVTVLTNDATGNTMQPVAPSSGKEGYLLATTPNASSGVGYAIQEIPAGDFRGATSGKYILISVSNAGLNNLTADGQKLFQNAAAYLVGLTAWTPIVAPTSPEVAGTTAYSTGATIELTASATGTSASTTYTWYKGDTWAEAEAAGAIQAAETAANNGNVYSKAACVVGDAGTYWCVIANGVGCTVSASQEITVSDESYDITFVSAHGTAPTATTGVSYDLPELTESGWEHQGWTANVDVIVDAAPVTAGTLIANGKTAGFSANVVFTAVWAQVFEVTFNLQGHGAAIAKQDILDGEKAAEPAAPAAIGWIFGGWFTDTDCTAGNEFDFANTTITANRELFAKWTAFVGCTELWPATSGDAPTAANEVINLQSGSKGGSIFTVSAKNDKFNESFEYTTSGFALKKGSNDVIGVSLNSEIAVGTKISVTLYSNNTGARGLVLNTATGGKVGSEGVTLGWSDATVGAVETFAYTAEAGDGLVGTNGFRLKRNNTVYLQCVRVESCGAAIVYHDLTSEVNIAGKGTVTLGASSVREGLTTTATYSDIDEAYEFVNWTISGTGASIADASANPATITMGTENAVVTLNLQLKPVYYTVTYKDGESSMGTEEVAENGHPTAIGISTAKKGFNFLGWSETDGGAVVELNTITITGATNIYAKYEAIPCPEYGTVFSMNITDPEDTEYNENNEFGLEIGATYTGGKAYSGSKSSTKRVGVIDSNGEYSFANNGDVTVKVDLDCALQEGDVLSFTSTPSRELKIQKVAGTDLYTTSGKSFTIPAESPLIGEYQFYLMRGNSQSTFKTFNVYRPAVLTGVTLSDAVVAIDSKVTPVMTLAPTPDAYVSSQVWSIEGAGEGTIATINTETGEVTGVAIGSVTVKVVLNGSIENTCTVTVIDSYTQVDVSETSEWNFAGAAAASSKQNFPSTNDEYLLANISGVNNTPEFNARALVVKGKYVSNSQLQAQTIRFNVTTSGKLTIRFACTSDKGEGNNRELYINGVATGSMTYNGEVTYTQAIPGGEVAIKAIYDDGGTPKEDIMNYKYIKFDVNPDVSDADYTRDLTQGRFGTICLPNGGVMVGADLFEIAYYGETSQKIFFDQIVNGVMEAGVPYVFLPREGASQLGVYYTDSENAPAGSRNGLIGSYTQETVTPNDGNYILLNNQYCFVNSTAYVGANRAYIKLSNINPTEPALAPGRIRMSMGVVGAPQVATGCENIEASDKPTKVMINGQLFIIRGEKTFDATGRLVK